METRVATSAEDRARIFRLRYEVMAEELGWTIGGDEVLGALRINLARDGGLGPYEELYPIDRNLSIILADRLAHANDRPVEVQ